MRLTTHANKSARAIVKLVEKATKRELGLDDCMAIAAHVQEAINAAQPNLYRMEKARAHGASTREIIAVGMSNTEVTDAKRSV
jgi:hypothetical protein